MERLTDALLRRLDGRDLAHRHGESMRLATVDADGWPHGAELSEGEVLAVDATSLRLCAWPASSTTANLRRTGLATLVLAEAGALWEVRLRAEERHAPPGAPELAYFAAQVESVREHRAKYAEVTSGPRYRLHDADAVLPRWEAQVTALRMLA
ncbi:MAG: pyridoxamine 5'-phosphate oxidase family protein [Planctomycetota bacterium]